MHTYYGLEVDQWLNWIHDSLPLYRQHGEQEESQRYIVEDEAQQEVVEKIFEMAVAEKPDPRISHEYNKYLICNFDEEEPEEIIEFAERLISNLDPWLFDVGGDNNECDRMRKDIFAFFVQILDLDQDRLNVLQDEAGEDEKEEDKHSNSKSVNLG
jgi:hypothetical protein